jgi:hypothetical protein
MATANQNVRLVTHWYTTPKELRAIADHLEAKWRIATVGQEVPKYDTYRDMVVVIDQEAMHEQEAELRRTVERKG